MPIISNAAPDEQSSSFYQHNKALCEQWEAYIHTRGGEINGRFNAYSLGIVAKVVMQRVWLIEVKKATYTSGNLILSAIYQNLQEVLVFTANFEDIKCGDFCITRSVFKRKEQHHPFYWHLCERFNKEMKDKSLDKIIFKNNVLKLVIHHKNDDFELVDRILSLDDYLAYK